MCTLTWTYTFIIYNIWGRIQEFFGGGGGGRPGSSKWPVRRDIKTDKQKTSHGVRMQELFKGGGGVLRVQFWILK